MVASCAGETRVVIQLLLAGANPRFFEPAHLPKGSSLRALTDWSRALTATSRTVEHPYNAGLMLEALVSQARIALNTRA